MAFLSFAALLVVGILIEGVQSSENSKYPFSLNSYFTAVLAEKEPNLTNKCDVSIEFFTRRKSDRSVRNTMQFLRMITSKILQLGII